MSEETPTRWVYDSSRVSQDMMKEDRSIDERARDNMRAWAEAGWELVSANGFTVTFAQTGYHGTTPAPLVSLHYVMFWRKPA